MASRRCAAPLVALALLVVAEPASGQVAVPSQWDTGNGAWNVATNWLPNDVPDNGGGLIYNVQIGNRPIAANALVTFVPEDGDTDTVSILAVSNGADLLTNGNQLNVLGQTTIEATGGTINVSAHATPGAPAFQSLDLDLNGGTLVMNGGIATVNGLLEINGIAVIQGRGRVDVGDFDAVAEKALENSSTIQAGSSEGLTLNANGVDTIDLDGDSEDGVVDASNAVANVDSDTQLLVVDGPLSDAFSGTLQVGQRDTLTFTNNFTMSGADVVMDGDDDVATMNGAGDVTSAAASVFTITGAATIANDMTFTGTANTITVNVNATLTLNGTVDVPDASALVLTGLGNGIVIGGSTTIHEAGAAADFDWDNGTTTVRGTGSLHLDVNRIDVGNNFYSGALTLEDEGDVNVQVAAAFWNMDGVLTKNNAGTSEINGDAVVIGGTVTVNGGVLDTGTTTLDAGSNITVNAGGTMVLGAASELAGPATITGAGLFRLGSTSTVLANTTIDTTSFDWDGTGSGTTHVISEGVIFTVNSTVWDADDATPGIDDNITVGGNGAQIVVNNIPTWTMARTLTVNALNVGTTTIGGSSRMVLSSALGVMNVNGNTNMAGLVTFGGASTTNIAAAATLTLQGSNDLNSHLMAGGTISGAGTLAADNGNVLRGNGTINCAIDFDGDAELVASGGVLDVNGAIADIGTLRTSGAAAVLDLALAFNTNVTNDGIVMDGGTLQGAQITTASLAKSLRGDGAVNSVVINNGGIEAQGGTLIVQTAANNNDWDGTTNTGQLNAVSGTLEVRDTALFNFLGSSQLNTNHELFINGFDLRYAVGSSLAMSAGSRLRGTTSTDFGGTLTVAAGAPAEIQYATPFFFTTSNVTISGTLRVANTLTTIESSAVFSGGGTLLNPAGSALRLQDNADVDVLIQNQGTMDLGAGVGPNAQVTGLAFQQDSSGVLQLSIGGDGPSEFDRIDLTGAASLAGELQLSLNGGFVPSLLDSPLTIISAPGGVTGQFTAVMEPLGLPAGLLYDVVYSPTLVQLIVVNAPIFSADFDLDGNVDGDDLAQWQGDFGENALSDADNDGDSDGADFLAWQQQLGSGAPATAASAGVPEPAGIALFAALPLIGAIVRSHRTRRVR